MRLHLFKYARLFYFVSILSLPIISYADELIPCPSVHTLQTSYEKLDTAQFVKDKYITYSATSIYQSNDLWWFVGVGDIVADSPTEAVKMGQTILKNANIQIDIYAIKIGSEYSCNYGPGYIQARGKYF